ncbi:hypothetical protein [Pseudomonas synxantha]|uniref:hypothetical protein n=1 Tax=Pseudomonas synxantha TaxID=47883 RepID=UPI001F14A19D|nr:hypothetical protein [Pseudomonas synxantha]
MANQRLFEPALERSSQAADDQFNGLHIDARHQRSRQGTRLERMARGLINQRASQ